MVRLLAEKQIAGTCKWLKSEPSPNWSILPEEERLKEDVWTTVVPGGPGVGLDDILKKIGLGKEK